MTIRAEHVGADRYRVRVYFGTEPDGRTVQRSRYFRARNQREANKLAAEHETALRTEKRASEKERGTVKALVKAWVKHRAGLDSPATIYRRQSIVNAIIHDLGRIKLNDLTPLHIDQWYATLRVTPATNGRARSEATVHHYHRVLHAILQQAYAWGMTERTPAARVTVPKRRRRAQATAPLPAVVQLLIRTAPPDLAVAARVLAATGLRRGELMALRWTDVVDGRVMVSKSAADIPGHPVKIKAPKNEESIRVVELDPATVMVLADHRGRLREAFDRLADDAYLFPDPLSPDRSGHTPRRPDWLSRSWRAHCGRHGAEVRLHALRHFHATELLDRGIPVTTVSARLGHAQISTTHNIYTHAVAGSDAAAAAVIADALEPRTALQQETPS